MSKKKVGIFIQESMAQALDTVAGQYAHKKGLCVSAAILMFLEADADTQRRFVERVAISELSSSHNLPPQQDRPGKDHTTK